MSAIRCKYEREAGGKLIASRYYNVRGLKWEARFFRKGECFPHTDVPVPRQGIWASPADGYWEQPTFLGESWRFVNLDPDLIYLPER